MLTDVKNLVFHAPPGKWKNPTQNCYFVCGISPMEPYTTEERYKAIQDEFDRRMKEKEESNKQLRETNWEVPSNKDTNQMYTVTRHIDGSWSCDCMGYKFRRKCSHIEKVKANVKQ